MDNSNANTNKANPSVMQSFKDKKSAVSPMKVLVIFIVLFGLGAGTGYLFSNSSGAAKNVPLASEDGSENTGKTFGSNDTSTFKDIAEGEVKEGGIEGEGQYHLVRTGGESQNVYMTSSTVDLSQFIGKKIKVWGQTQTAQKAGWLMDVGRVEVL